MNLKQELDARVEQGLISMAPSEDGLLLYNYANRCVFEKAWDQFTLMARGLVLDEAGNVIARPWPKFFNLGERTDQLPSETPELATKYDGSLVIAFCHQGTWRAITRGSWYNPQTEAAKRWLHRPDPSGHALNPDLTHMFEIVAPWNRIVVSYDTERLILLGAVVTKTGEDLSYSASRKYGLLHGLECAEFVSKPISEVDLTGKFSNQEGYVARFSNGYRVKLKFSEYFRLHKMVTGLSVKAIWEELAGNREVLSLEQLPDEFSDWYFTQRQQLQDAFRDIKADCDYLFNKVGTQPNRRAYAEAFLKYKDRSSILFNLLDGKDPAPEIWKRVKPSAHQVFKVDEN